MKGMKCPTIQHPMHASKLKSRKIKCSRHCAKITLLDKNRNVSATAPQLLAIPIKGPNRHKMEGATGWDNGKTDLLSYKGEIPVLPWWPLQINTGLVRLPSGSNRKKHCL
jgi:hypothetical protein